MTKNEITETLLAFEVPVVRHLAWLCLSPQLLKHELSFDPAAHLPPGCPPSLWGPRETWPAVWIWQEDSCESSPN